MTRARSGSRSTGDARLGLTLAALLLAAAPIRASIPPQDALAPLRQAVAEADTLLRSFEYEQTVLKLEPVIAGLAPYVPGIDTATTLLVEALSLRGQANALRRRHDDARRDFQALLRLDPDYTLSDAAGQLATAALDQARTATLGRLIVRTKPPDARTQVDGRPFAMASGFIAAGPHKVLITRPGHEPAAREVEVPAGGSQELDVDLPRTAAVISVATSPADVEVWVRGEMKGRSIPTDPPSDTSLPFVVDDGKLGERVSLVFKRACHVTENRYYEVTRLDDINLSPVTLARAVGVVSVSGAAGLPVEVDGAARGASPLQLELCEGEHRLEITSPTGAYRKDLSIEAGKSYQVQASLKPVFALLGPVGGIGAYRGPDLRLDVERRLAGTELLLSVPPKEPAGAGSRGAAFLDYDVFRRPASAAARETTPREMAALTDQFAAELGVQGVAHLQLQPEAARDLNRFLLSFVAAGNTEPDVIEVDLSSGPALNDAAAQLNAMPPLHRATVGLFLADVDDAHGVAIVEVGPGAPIAAYDLSPGDLVVAVADEAIGSAAAFEAAIASKVGTNVTVDAVDHQGQAKRVSLPVALAPCLISAADESLLFNGIMARLQARLATAPDDGVARLNLAVALMRFTHWERALAELQRVTLQTVAGISQGTVDYLRGECLFRIGRLDEAREAWQSAAKAEGALLTHEGPAISGLAAERLAGLAKGR